MISILFRKLVSIKLTRFFLDLAGLEVRVELLVELVGGGRGLLLALGSSRGAAASLSLGATPGGRATAALPLLDAAAGGPSARVGSAARPGGCGGASPGRRGELGCGSDEVNGHWPAIEGDTVVLLHSCKEKKENEHIGTLLSGIAPLLRATLFVNSK